MSGTPRIFGPNILKRKLLRIDTPQLAVDFRGEEVVLGKDGEIAELNAQRVAQVLKRIFKRRKQGKGK